LFYCLVRSSHIGVVQQIEQKICQKFRIRAIKPVDCYKAILCHTINKKAKYFKNRVVKLNTERKSEIRLHWKLNKQFVKNFASEQ